MAVLVWIVLFAMTAIMLGGWIFQRAANNGGWTDVFWTFGAGATCAVTALMTTGAHAGVPWRRLMVAGMMVVWSLRLGGYVARRVAKSPEDVRYASLREEWGENFQRNMFGLLISQAPLTALISISTLLAARNPNPSFRIWDAVALMVFVGAIVGETAADRQMQSFKADRANDGKVCDQGLWSWSRHPNYFFEALIWMSYPIIAIDITRPLTLAALIAPGSMFCVVRFATGIPPLEKAMLMSKGDAYRQYQRDVSALFPRPRHR